MEVIQTTVEHYGAIPPIHFSGSVNGSINAFLSLCVKINKKSEVNISSLGVRQ